MKIVLQGEPRTKKNSMRPITVRRRDGKSVKKLLPSEAYEQYEADCLRQITGLSKLRLDRPVNVQCVYRMSTRRRVDLVNLLEATCDILVKAGVLADDNSRIVAAHDGSRVLYDKENPGVEITITDI